MRSWKDAATPLAAGPIALATRQLPGTAGTSTAHGLTLDVALADDMEQKTLTDVQSLPGGMRASTAIEQENGRPLEIDWISGGAVRLAKKRAWRHRRTRRSTRFCRRTAMAVLSNVGALDALFDR